MYPTESQCAIRQRIGWLKYKHDKWFEVNETTEADALVAETKDNVLNYILPYFETAKTKKDVLQLLDKKQLSMSHIFAKLIIYGEYQEFDKAQKEYSSLLNDKYIVANLKSSLDEYKVKYGLQG